MLPTDGRRREKFSGLLTLQRRLRHLKSIMARNVDVDVNGGDNVRLFFTLHSTTSSNAFYKSETSENNTNPNWAAFTPSQFSKTANLASPSVVVLLWASVSDREQPFCEWTANFSGLVFIGDKVPNRGHDFASNTILFGMPEGYYTSPDSVVLPRTPMPTNPSMVPKNKTENFKDVAKRPAAVHNYVKRSYTVCNLQRIHTVRRAMLQTELSVQRLQVSIRRNLNRDSSLDSKKRMRESLMLQINLLDDELRFQRACCEDDNAAIQKLRASLHDRSRELAEKIQALRNGREELVERRRTLINVKEETLKISSHLMTRRKQLISGLSFIYPIQEVPGKGFTICGVRLPNSEDFSGHDEITIAVALGSVCHYVTMISQFLNVPLRYPVKHDGSKSKIVDHILEKLPDSEREFPLYSKGKDKLQFNYGVYLMNKNIAQLRFYCGITTHDLRATLPNLHSLLELRLGVKLDPIYAHLAKPAPNENSAAAESVAPLVQGPDEGLETGGTANGVDTQSLDSLTLLRQSDSTCHVTAASDDLAALRHDDQYVNLSCSLDQGLNNIQRYHQFQQNESSPSGNTFASKRAYYKLEQLHHGQSGSEPVLLSYRHFEESTGSEEQKQDSSISWLVAGGGGGGGNNLDDRRRDMPNLTSLQHYCECDDILASGLCPCCGSGAVKEDGEAP